MLEVKSGLITYEQVVDLVVQALDTYTRGLMVWERVVIRLEGPRSSLCCRLVPTLLTQRKQ